MSKIRGGGEGEYHDWGTGTCGIKYWGDNRYEIHCNMSIEELRIIAKMRMESHDHYWWCCDSCATSTYCDEAAGGTGGYY